MTDEDEDVVPGDETLNPMAWVYNLTMILILAALLLKLWIWALS